MFLVVIGYFDIKNVLNAKMTIEMIIQLRQKNLRFCKIIGANTIPKLVLRLIKLGYAMPEGHRVNSLKESSAKLISKAVPKNPSV